MPDKLTDGTDTSLTKSAPENEKQEAPEQEMLKDLPPEAQKVVSQLLFSSRSIGPVQHPLFDKLNEGHITTILELSGKDDERTFEYSKADRRYRMAYVLIGLIAFFVLTFYMMPVDKGLYQQIVQLLIAAGGGFGAGYGVRHWQG